MTVERRTRHKRYASRTDDSTLTALSPPSLQQPPTYLYQHIWSIFRFIITFFIESLFQTIDYLGRRYQQKGSYLGSGSYGDVIPAVDVSKGR